MGGRSGGGRRVEATKSLKGIEGRRRRGEATDTITERKNKNKRGVVLGIRDRLERGSEICWMVERERERFCLFVFLPWVIQGIKTWF